MIAHVSQNKPNRKALYNLSDIIRFKREHGLNFQGSIAEEYLTIQGPPYYQEGFFDNLNIDFKCLQDIVKKRVLNKNNDNCFAIHARVFDYLHKVHTVDHFIKIINKYKLNIKFSKCLLFYGNHKTNLKQSIIQQSEDYIQQLKNQIEDLGFTCELVSNSADEDFVALATSKFYIAGARGFGWLAASINPNEVIWDFQNPPKFTWEKRYLREGLLNGYEFHKKIKNVHI